MMLGTGFARVFIVTVCLMVNATMQMGANKISFFTYVNYFIMMITDVQIIDPVGVMFNWFMLKLTLRIMFCLIA